MAKDEAVTDNNDNSAVMAELMKMVGELRNEVAELKAAKDLKLPKMETKKVRRPDHPEPGGAWVVRTPLEYNGSTANVTFVNGLAVVDEDAENADGIIHQLEHDFGYTVQVIQAAEVAAIRKLMAAPGKQKKGLAEKLAEPLRI